VVEKRYKRIHPAQNVTLKSKSHILLARPHKHPMSPSCLCSNLSRGNVSILPNPPLYKIIIDDVMA
jgi:hypothetical protein